MKSLLPSLKEKKRYLVFEIISENKITVSRPMNEIIKQVNKILGIFDSAEAGIMPVTYKNNKAMIKVSNQSVDKVKASLLFINEMGTQDIIIKSVGLSGILNKAKNYM